VDRIDRQDTQRPADRRLDAGSGGPLHQAQKKLHGVFAQPLTLAGQPLVEISVTQRKSVEQVRPIERRGML